MTSTIPSATLQKFVTFGDLLRFLRRRAGMTQMELAIAVGYSDAQISRLEQNVRPPDIPTIEARFIDALDLEEDVKAAARLLELAANVRREDAPTPGLSPYKGLTYFDEGDAELFVGREALTARLCQRVLSLASAHSQPRLLAIVGASGCGKSSLVRAGLVPALRWGPVTADWQIHVITPTGHPLESLANTLPSRSLGARAALMSDLLREPRSLHVFAEKLARSANSSNVLLVVDQFEEVFSLCRAEQERGALIENLLIAASEPYGRVLVLLTLRADFYAACAAYRSLRQAIASSQEYIGAMEPDELRRVIEEPARRGNWQLEEGVTDLMLHEVGGEPGGLPLLSHALLETWERRRGRTLTLGGYTASGGVRGAIAETAEMVFSDQFDSRQQALARRIFLRLTELGEDGAPDTRRRAALDELTSGAGEAEAAQAVLKALTDARLITAGEKTAEVAHEALIREWPRLRAWLQEDRDGLRLHRQLLEAAQDWERLSREGGALYRGARLAQAREWGLAHRAELDLLEREFLDASLAAAEHEAAEKELRQQEELAAAQARAKEQAHSANQLRFRNRVISAVGSISLILAILTGSFGLQARDNLHIAQANIAQAESLRLAAEANVILAREGDPQLAALLSIRALRGAYSPQADGALAAALPELYGRQVLRGHTAAVYSAAFSPNSRYAVTASIDGTARLWDVRTGKMVHLFSLDSGGLVAVAFSPDGKSILTGGNDKTLRLWSVATGRQVLLITGHTAGISAVAFSPDGHTLLSSSGDGTVRLWDAATGAALRTLTGGPAFISDAVFSRDGHAILTTSFDGVARLWDTDSGSLILTFGSLQSSRLTSAAFSADGTRIVTGSDDHTATLWDEATAAPICIFRGHTDSVDDVAFSPDGHYVLTGSEDLTARIWDANTCNEVRHYEGLESGVRSVAYSPDGQMVLTGGIDGIVHVWAAPDSRPPRLFQHRQQNIPSYIYSPSATYIQTLGGVNAVAFSPDGRQILTGGDDGQARLWDAESGRQVGVLEGHTKGIITVAYSPDGKTILTGSDDNTIRLWDVATGSELYQVAVPVGGMGPLSFSPDGTYFFVRSTAINFGFPVDVSFSGVWNSATGRPASLPEFPSWMTRSTLRNLLALPQDQRTMLVSGGHAAEVDLLDRATGAKRCSFLWPGGFAQSYNQNGYLIGAYSADGKYALVYDSVHTARLWNTGTCNLVDTFSDPGSHMNSVAISRDGKYVLTGHDDNIARLWAVATGGLLRELIGHSSWVTSVAFSPDGRFLLTGSEDGTARLWDTDYHDTIRYACSLLSRDLTSTERTQYNIADAATTCDQP